jgi:hypothetical protein
MGTKEHKVMNLIHQLSFQPSRHKLGRNSKDLLLLLSCMACSQIWLIPSTELLLSFLTPTQIWLIPLVQNCQSTYFT